MHSIVGNAMSELFGAAGIQGVDLFGTLEQVGAAQAKLSNILAENAGDWCEDSKWGARVRFFLLPDMASIVIGKKGSTVQRIIKESNAGVRVSNESDENNLQSCQVCISSYCSTVQCWLKVLPQVAVALYHSLQAKTGVSVL